LPNGSPNSIFVIKPAYKTLSEGSMISAGDLVTFHLNKKIAGANYTLTINASPGHMRSLRPEIVKSLRLEHPFVAGGVVLSACTESDASAFHALLFCSGEHADTHGQDLSPALAAHRALKGEDVVAFYNKHFSAYLYYDEAASHNGIRGEPSFYSSNRISDKARKKCTWMWKIERAVLYCAGETVTSGDYFRIKHVVSNKYLSETQRGGLTMVDDYRDPAIRTTKFHFKCFLKPATTPDASSADRIDKAIQLSDLAFILSDTRGVSEGGVNAEDSLHTRSAPDKYLTYAGSQSTVDAPLPARNAVRRSAHGSVQVAQLKLAPASDALVIMSMSESYLANVRQVRAQVLQLEMFQKELEALDAAGGCKPVLALVDKCFPHVRKALQDLVINCSAGDDLDPMSKDGIPNRVLQKVLRELGVIKLCVEMVQEPFRRGIDIDAIATQDAAYMNLITILDLMYRLMKQMVRIAERVCVCVCVCV